MQRWSSSLSSASPTGTPRRIDVDLTWILRSYFEDQVSTNFHVNSKYLFNVILMVEISTLFSRMFFDETSLFEKSILFLHIFLNVISLVEISTLFFPYFFYVISLVQKSTLFPHIFSDVISMVEISTLFSRMFFDETSLFKKSVLFLRIFFECNFVRRKILVVSMCFFILTLFRWAKN